MVIKVKKLNENATIPTRSHINDAGWDLYSAETLTIESGKNITVKTEIAFDIPEGHVGLIYERSGLASKSGLIKKGGVIDSGYHGAVGIILYNSSLQTIEIKKGDRIAQILFHQLPHTNLTEVSSFTKTSERSQAGFGSTGK